MIDFLINHIKFFDGMVHFVWFFSIFVLFILEAERSDGPEVCSCSIVFKVAREALRPATPLFNVLNMPTF